MASFYNAKSHERAQSLETTEDGIDGFSAPPSRSYFSRSMATPASKKLIKWLLPAFIGLLLLSLQLRSSRSLWSKKLWAEKPSMIIEGADHDLAQLEPRILTKFDSLVMKNKIVYPNSTAEYLNHTGFWVCFAISFHFTDLLARCPERV